jgi:hypothetical protein
MGSTKKHKIREPKKRKHRSRSKSRSPERNKHRHHKKHHKDRKKEKLIKDKNGECVQKYNSYDSEGKLQLFLNSFSRVFIIAHQVCVCFYFNLVCSTCSAHLRTTDNRIRGWINIYLTSV